MNDITKTAIKNAICDLFTKEVYDNAWKALSNPTMEDLDRDYLIYSVFYEQMNEAQRRNFLTKLRQKLCFDDWIELFDHCSGDLKEHAYVEAINAAAIFDQWRAVHDRSRNDAQQTLAIEKMKENARAFPHYLALCTRLTAPGQQDERSDYRRKAKEDATGFNDWRDVCDISPGRKKPRVLWNMLTLAKTVEELVETYDRATPDVEGEEKANIEIRKVRAQALNRIGNNLPEDANELFNLARRPDDDLRKMALRKLETLEATIARWTDIHRDGKRKEVLPVMDIAARKIAQIVKKDYRSIR